MSKIICFYWTPGSGGDTILRMLENTGEYQTTNNEFYFDEVKGRTVTVKNKMFDFLPNDIRDMIWTDDQLNKLMNLRSLIGKTIVIPTHSLKTVQFFEKKLKGECVSMGIAYGKNLWPFVLKNQIKKLYLYDDSFDKTYNTKFHEKIKQKNLYDWFIMSERLLHKEKLISVVDYDFDIRLNLHDILAGKITFNELCSQKNNDKIFNDWLKKQDVLYRYCYDADNMVKNILGFNHSCEQYINAREIQLSTLDKCLLSNGLTNKDVPLKSIKTLQDLNNMLN